MLSRVREISLYLIGIVIAVIGVIIIGVDVSAIDEPKCEGENSDWFNICVGGSYRTYDPMDPLGTDYKGSLIDSTEKVRSDGAGNYYTEGHFSQRNIDLEIKGKELWIYAGRGCQPDSKAVIAKVPFKENIADFRNDVQKAIGGKEWTFTCDGPYMDTDYIVGFSSTNIFEESETEIPGVPVDETTEGTGGVQPNCINSGGLGTLGWILCPTLDIMNGATEGVYNTFLAPALQTDPQLFTDKGAATIEGWGTFRKIANVLFIIFFLFVIFSQLTGVGISNYGIKKILPKMILTAIMINLSYWLCIVFVDLSNILGNSFQLMFNNLFTGDASVDLTPVGGGVIGVSGALISAGILAAIMGGGWVIFNNPAIMVTLLISALGVLIAILFLFILLAVREAALVVLVVLSPLAIICYMLPNTKTLFDKWLKFFKGLLLVYPIAGLLIGGGNYVSNLLLYVGQGDSGVFSAFTAMIVGIVPIFFIPTVLRGAFSAMGNIGARISGMGQQASRAFTGAARNSQAYKNAQEMGRMRQTRIRAGINPDGTQKQLGRFGTMIRGGKRNITRNAAQYLKDQDEIRQAEDFMRNPVAFEAAKIAQEKRAEANEIANYETLINSQTRNGEDETALYEMFDKYMANEDKHGAMAVARIAGRRKDTAARFAEAKLTNAGQQGPGIASTYNNEMLQSVAKEMATGENSGQYKSSSPLAFEFAAQLNRGTAGTQDYNSWLSQTDDNGNYVNVNTAMENYVTDSKDLVGLKNSSLKEVADLMDAGMMDAKTADRIRRLANETIDNRNVTGIWDSTKSDNIHRIAGRVNPGGAGGGAGGAGAGGVTDAGNFDGDGVYVRNQ